MAEFRRNFAGKADLILLGSNVVTLWPELPRAEALAVRDGLIVAVGSDRQMASLAGPHTSLVECQGKCVTPGFHDAHLHLAASTGKRLSVDCSPSAVGSIRDIQEVIRKRARSTAPGTWIRAGDYDEFQLLEKRHPTRWDLDLAAPDHPVKLRHRSLHACVFNSAALRIANLIEGGSGVPGVRIEVDPITREPTGLLYVLGSYLGSSIVPPFDENDFRRALGQVFEELLSNGITSVNDASFSNSLDEWEQLSNTCSKTASRPRIGFMVGQPHLHEFFERGMATGFGDEWLSIGATKLMLTDTNQGFYPSLEALTEQVTVAQQLGFQVAIHAVEESTVCVAAEAIGRSKSARSDLAPRIEHCSVVPSPLIHRLAGLGIAVVTQPSFLYHSGDRYLADVDEHLHPSLYPMKSLVECGVVVGAGSDAPVSPPRPIDGIYSAVTRLSRSGRLVAGDERLSVEQVLRLHTYGSARACGEHRSKGSIQPGKLADLVVLSTDLLSTDPNSIRDIQVEMTIIGGKIVWQRKR